MIVKGCNRIKERTKYCPCLVLSEPAGGERVSSILREAEKFGWQRTSGMERTVYERENCFPKQRKNSNLNLTLTKFKQMECDSR